MKPETLILIVFSFLTLGTFGCGADDSKGPLSNESPRSSNPDSSKETSETKGPETYSMAIASKDDLPPCDEARRQQLIYAKREGKFFTCSDLVWSEISIKGEKGDAGERGPIGQVGATGAKGDPGSSATPIPTNQWYDPITSKYWLIGGTGVYASIVNTCSGSWRLPTRAEAILAGQHGIFTASSAISGPTDIWTSDVGPTNSATNMYVVVKTPSVQESEVLKTTVHGVMCIQQ